MTRLKLSHIHRFKDRHGRIRHYFRRPGYKQVALPGLPGSAEFNRAYEAALGGQPLAIASARADPRSMSALVASWYSSADFTQLAGSSQGVDLR